MRTLSLGSLGLVFVLLAAPACASDKAAADPNAPAAAKSDAPSASTTAPAPASGQPAEPAAKPGLAARDPNAVVAKVNGSPILFSEVLQSTKNFLQAQNAPAEMPEAQLAQVRQIVLDALIGNELLFQKSKADGIAVPQAEIDKVVADSKKAFPTEDAWLADLKQRGLDKAQVERMVTHDIAIEKTLKAAVFDKLNVTDEELKKYFDEHPEEMTKPEQVRASHILFRVSEGADAAARKPAHDKAEQVLARAKAGEDFAALARQNSEDPASAAAGGDLGFIGKGQTVAAFEQTAFALTVGQISGLVETPYGYHIIKVTGKQDAKKADLTEVQQPLRNFLMQRKAREQVQALIETLRSSAKVELL